MFFLLPNHKKEALIKMPMPVSVCDGYISNHQTLFNVSSEDLNVSGKRCQRNPEKSIWSYNPEDTSLDVNQIF
jgi:hypothetical protein